MLPPRQVQKSRKGHEMTARISKQHLEYVSPRELQRVLGMYLEFFICVWA